MTSDLVRIHHADYDEDLPFWIRHTQGLDPILEIGCGHGRVTLPLLGEGREVVGLDRDGESIAYLKGILEKYPDEDRQRISLVKVDILEFQSDAPFGSVIIPCNTYSTFTAKDRVRLLTIAISSLKEGGAFIASLPNPQQTLRIFSEISQGEVIEDPDPEIVIDHPETGYPVQVSSRIRIAGESLFWDWIYDHLHPDGRVERTLVTVEHFPELPDKILAEMYEAGFREVVCQGDFAGAEYDKNSPYLILICRK